jgi:hypothetical protein
MGKKSKIIDLSHEAGSRFAAVVPESRRLAVREFLSADETALYQHFFILSRR